MLPDNILTKVFSLLNSTTFHTKRSNHHVYTNWATSNPWHFIAYIFYRNYIFCTSCCHDRKSCQKATCFSSATTIHSFEHCNRFFSVELLSAHVDLVETDSVPLFIKSLFMSIKMNEFRSYGHGENKYYPGNKLSKDGLILVSKGISR